jgi:hypothetical protein
LNGMLVGLGFVCVALFAGDGFCRVLALLCSMLALLCSALKLCAGFVMFYAGFVVFCFETLFGPRPLLTVSLCHVSNLITGSLYCLCVVSTHPAVCCFYLTTDGLIWYAAMRVFHVVCCNCLQEVFLWYAVCKRLSSLASNSLGLASSCI